MNQDAEFSTTLAPQNTIGWHLRPAGLLVGVANMFESEIMVRCGRRMASAKSLLGILTLGAGRGARLYVSARGHDAQMAIKAIKEKFSLERPGADITGEGDMKRCASARKCPASKGSVMTTFKLCAGPGVKKVYLAGDFNEWDPCAEPMSKRGGLFTKSLKLEEGLYHYKFVVDGEWQVDPCEPWVVSEMGTTNNVISVRCL